MITKSLIAPSNPIENDEWCSPDGHSPEWHKAWNGEEWDETVYTDPLNPENLDDGSNTPALPVSDGKQEPDLSANGKADGSKSKGRKGSKA